MENLQRVLFSDGEGGKAEIMKVHNMYRLTVWVNTWSIYYQKTFPTYRNARGQLAAMSTKFSRTV